MAYRQEVNVWGNRHPYITFIVNTQDKPITIGCGTPLFLLAPCTGAG